MVCLPSVQMVRRVVVIQQLPTLQKRQENLQQLIAARRRSRPQSLRAKFLAKPATGLGLRYENPQLFFLLCRTSKAESIFHVLTEHSTRTMPLSLIQRPSMVALRGSNQFSSKPLSLFVLRRGQACSCHCSGEGIRAMSCFSIVM